LKIDEVTAWKPFITPSGEVIDLSFLDAHQAFYRHEKADKPPITYEFWVTYSFHCFAKDYGALAEDQRQQLMYHGPRESRPSCHVRYGLAKSYLRLIISNLGSPEALVRHAGWESYATAKIIDSSGTELWYLVPFKVFRERKKFRIHVTSAYPIAEKPGGDKVGFFTIAHNLKAGKALPKPRR